MIICHLSFGYANIRRNRVNFARKTVKGYIVAETSFVNVDLQKLYHILWGEQRKAQGYYCTWFHHTELDSYILLDDF